MNLNILALRSCGHNYSVGLFCGELQLKVSLSANLHTDRECGWLEGNFNVTICSRSQYGCHAKIAGSNSVTVRRAGANSVAGRCGKQMPVDTWQPCECAVQLFLYHSAQAKWFFIGNVQTNY